MVYIHPSDFSRSSDFDEGDSICEECGYNLRGLPWGTVCPECGEPSTRQARAENRPKDLPLSEMPESFVRRLAFCCITATIVLPAFIARMFVPAVQVQNNVTAFIIDISIAVLWVFGVGVLTLPIDHAEAIRWGMGTRGILRRIARWCALAGIGVVVFTHTPSTAFTIMLLDSSMVVLGVGLICLFLFLCELAIWVRDLTAKRYLESAAWGAPMLLIIAVVLDKLPIPPLLALLITIGAGILALGGVIGMIMLTFSVLRAVAHAREFQAYQKRRIESGDSARFPTPE